MNDIELEDRVRTTLRVVANATPRAVPAAARRARWPLAAAAALVVATATVVVVRRDDTSRVIVGASTTTTTTAVSTAAALPEGYDLATASPVFAAAGSVDAVADAYLRSRFPDFPNPGVTVEAAVVTGDRATAAWRTGDSSGTLATGTLDLRVVGSQWTVIAATTDGVRLGDVRHDGERIIGTIATDDDEGLFVDVLNALGEPVPGAPRPDGQPGAAYRYGTAGGGPGTVSVDVGIGGTPGFLRVSLVGGTILSITEVRLDPPASSTTVLASSRAQEPAWELVATEERSGHWVTFRAPGLEGVYRLQADPPDSGFTELGVCCRLAGHVVVIGSLMAEATGMQLILADDRVIAAETVSDPFNGMQFGVVLVPLGQVPPNTSANVQIRDADGFEDAFVELDLSQIGG